MKKQNRFRLQLEALEQRWCPADYTWTGAANNGEWADSRNWNFVRVGGMYPNANTDNATITGSQTIKYEDWTDANNVPHTVSGTIGDLHAGSSFSGNLRW